MAGCNYGDFDRNIIRNDCKQAVNVRVRTRPLAGIHGMFCQDREAMFGCLRVVGTKHLLKILVDRERALLARHSCGSSRHLGELDRQSR